MNALLLFTKQDNDSKDLFLHITKSEALRSNIYPLCVDSKDVLEIISSSTNVTIDIIPCILLRNQNNSISKFEGIVKIFQVLNDIESNSRNQNTKTSHTDIDDIIDVENVEEDFVEELAEELENSTPETIKITSPPITQPRVATKPTKQKM